MTRQLYYEDAYQKEFTARVTGLGEDESGPYLLLDQTLFFPEGGGQPADRGTIHGLRIVDAQLCGDEIRHYLEIGSNGSGNGRGKGDKTGEAFPAGFPLKEGDQVRGRIDWERRFDLMQQHSGEHIVSGCIHARYGYDNVGFHMGDRFITIDLNGLLDKEQLADLEREVNRYVWKDGKTRVFYASDEEKQILPYRSKLDFPDEVRLVEFPGADLCACCGLHVRRSGEIGLVKLVSVRHFRSGVRIEMLSGKRALDYLNESLDQNTQIAVALSTKPGDTFEALGKLQKENYKLRGELQALRRRRFDRMAAACKDRGNVLVFAQGLAPADFPKCADEILETCGGSLVLVSGDDQSGYRYVAGVREGTVRDLVGAMNQALSGKGGGKPAFCQGRLAAGEAEITAFFQDRAFNIFDL